MNAFREFFWRMFLVEGAWYFVARTDRMIVPMIWNGVVFETRLQVVDHSTIWRVLNRLPSDFRAYEAQRPAGVPIFSPRLAAYANQKS